MFKVCTCLKATSSAEVKLKLKPSLWKYKQGGLSCRVWVGGCWERGAPVPRSPQAEVFSGYHSQSLMSTVPITSRPFPRLYRGELFMGQPHTWISTRSSLTRHHWALDLSSGWSPRDWPQNGTLLISGRLRLGKYWSLIPRGGEGAERYELSSTQIIRFPNCPDLRISNTQTNWYQWFIQNNLGTAA